MGYHADSRYVYAARIANIVDGDTVDLVVEATRTVDFGFAAFQNHTLLLRHRFRLYGIDTPETYSTKRDSEEYAAGMRATERLRALCPEGSFVWIASHKSGKFGRYLAVMWKDEEEVGDVEKSINATLVREGFAKLYKSDPLPITLDDAS